MSKFKAFSDALDNHQKQIQKGHTDHKYIEFVS